ncbi:MAG TPA: hypothetical protein P5121_23350, partial [Caldilineaceae bacterium]|nr:hypothetical protein [Caldilineaceae bacterium]
MEESTLRCLLSDLITYLPAKLLPALTGFITAPILTRLFAPAVYADYALAVGLSGLLYALAISGLASTPIRFLPVYTKQRRLPVFFVTLGTLIGLMVLGTSVVTLIVLRLLQPRLPGQLYPLLQISVLLFGVQALVNVLLDGARAQERSRLYTTFDLLTRYGALGLGLLLVMGFGMGIDGLLWG